MAFRKMNEDVAYARNTESGCKYRNSQIPPCYNLNKE